MIGRGWRPNRAAAGVAAVAVLWLRAGPVGLVLGAMLAAVLWLELYTDAGVGG